jgi:hypothetical protein
LIALMVWLGYATTRMIAPDRVELCIGVPLLLAFLPQNVFYAMNSDVLSPLCCGALFLCVLQWLRAQGASVWLGALTGLAIAATYLTKLSNLPLIAVALINLCKIASDDPTDAARWLGGAWSGCDLCCNSGLQLDAVDEVSVWRRHRVNSENCIAWLDMEVAP